MKRLWFPSAVVAIAAAVVAQVGITTRVSEGLGVQANDDTVRIAVSANDRYVVFESTATNIVNNDDNGVTDIFLRDRLLGTTERVSLTSTGTEANAASFRPDVSENGRYIVFQSAATNIVPNDTNAVSDIFVRDRQTQNTYRVSLTTGGVQGNGSSTFGAISDDGEFIAFLSAATNLVAGDTNAETDAFRHSLSTGTTIRVSLSVNSQQCNGGVSDVAINADGNYVAFSSDATNVVLNDTNGVVDVFRREISNPSTTIISRHTNGTFGNGISRSPSMNGNGQIVAFRSAATNLVGSDTNGVDDIFVRNVGTVTTVRSSTSTSGNQANGASVEASISTDGIFVAFESSATNLVLNDTNGQSDAFRKDLQTGATLRASVSTQGIQGNGTSDDPNLGTGSYVVFTSGATNLQLNDTNAAIDGFVRDVGAGTTAIATVTSGEAHASSLSGAPDNSGRFIAFYSQAENLVINDSNGFYDVFLKDRATRAVSIISLSSAEAQANADSSNLSISADARFVVFESEASNLVTGDNNGVSDIFLRDRQLGTTSRVSVSSSGVEANGISEYPHVSGDGRYIVFESAATNLVVNDTNQMGDIFVHDRVTGITTRESVRTSGTEGNGASTSARLSGDGNVVVFMSYATNLVTGDTNGTWDVFRRNRSTGATTVVSVSSSEVLANNLSGRPSVSADGNLVAFDSTGSNLVTGDTNAVTDIFLRNVSNGTTSRLSISSGGTQGNGHSRDPFISADGTRVLFESASTNLVTGDTNGFDDLFVRVVGELRTYRVSVSTQGAQANSSSGANNINGDGSVAVFSSGGNNLVPFDLNGHVDIFVSDWRITPNLVTIVRGVVDVGSGTSLLFPEDERIDFRPGITFTTSQAPIEIVVEAQSHVLNPPRLEFAVEFHATSPSIRQTIEMFNFDTQAYEVTDIRQATLTDSTALVAITGNPGRFVSASGLLRSRVSYKASGPVFAYPWRSRTDHIRWSVF